MCFYLTSGVAHFNICNYFYNTLYIPLAINYPSQISKLLTFVVFAIVPFNTGRKLTPKITKTLLFDSKKNIQDCPSKKN